MSKNSLSKSERIKSRADIDELFNSGQKIFSKRLTLIYLSRPLSQNESHLQMGVTCPKRNFKKAVDRNRVKRLIREAYRVSKPNLDSNTQHLLFFIYNGRKLPDFATIEVAMKELMGKLEAR